MVTESCGYFRDTFIAPFQDSKLRLYESRVNTFIATVITRCILCISNSLTFTIVLINSDKYFVPSLTPAVFKYCVRLNTKNTVEMCTYH